MSTKQRRDAQAARQSGRFRPKAHSSALDDKSFNARCKRENELYDAKNKTANEPAPPATMNKHDEPARPRPVASAPDEILASFSRLDPDGSPAALRISISRFERGSCIHARRWSRSRDGKWHPTREGVTFNHKELEVAIAALEKAKRLLAVPPVNPEGSDGHSAPEAKGEPTADEVSAPCVPPWEGR